MKEEKYSGFKVTFPMSDRIMVSIYMKKEYYEKWKYQRDASIKGVEVEIAELPISYFIG